MSKYDLDYFVNRSLEEWGSINEDDKYFSDEDLMDSFYAFYVYVYAYLQLPSPTRSQLQLAEFISNREHSHRMVMAMRGLA